MDLKRSSIGLLSPTKVFHRSSNVLHVTCRSYYGLPKVLYRTSKILHRSFKVLQMGLLGSPWDLLSSSHA